MYQSSLLSMLKNQPQDTDIFTEKRKTFTVKKLLHSSENLAQYLSNEGVAKDSRVVLVVEPGFEFLKVLYACMLLNATVSIIDPEMGQDNYLAKLNQFNPDFAFVDSQLLLINEHPLLKKIIVHFRKNLPVFPRSVTCKLFTTGKRLPIFRKHIHLPCNIPNSDSDTIKRVSDKDDFLIVYTSGTLSEPKGVVHSYHSLSESVKVLSELLKNQKNGRIATHLPHFMLLGISIGMQVYKWQYPMTGKRQYDYITTNKITTLFGPPTDFIEIISYCNSSNQQLPSCLNDIILGSAPIYPSFLKKLIKHAASIKISCLYGMTENLMTSYVDGREKLNYQEKGDLIGRPFTGIKTSIIENEIAITSSQLFSRYFGKLERETPHMTGDLGMITNDGNLVLLGRKKDMIIRRNFNLYPALYESSICRIDGINEAALIGIYNEKKEDEDVVLVIDAIKELKESILIKQLQNGTHSIDKEALPDKIIFAKIPKSGRQSKPDKTKLKKQIINRL